jgi:hypothetical protein
MNRLNIFKIGYIVNLISSISISGYILYLLNFRRDLSLIPNIFSISILYCFIYAVFDIFCDRLHYAILNGTHFSKTSQISGFIFCIISLLITFFLCYKMVDPIDHVYSLPFIDYFIDYIILYFVFTIILSSLYTCVRFWQLTKIVNSISNDIIENIGKEEDT